MADSSSSSAALDAAKSLMRMAVRSFHPEPKAIVLFDAILAYNCVPASELVNLFPSTMLQPKEIRQHLQPLQSSRLVQKYMAPETRVGNTRSSSREYFFVSYWEAIDAIKYRMVKLTEKVAEMYKAVEGTRKDWWCPRCKAEYDELSILDKVDPERGFYCERCGATLNQNEAAVKERGDHAKIRKVNDQLRPFNSLMAIVDAGEIPENDGESAYERRRRIPKQDGVEVRGAAEYVPTMSAHKAQDQRKTQAVVDGSALDVSILDEKTRAEREKEEKERKAKLQAQMNVLPEWHAKSAIKDEVKKEENGGPSPMINPKDEDDDKKGDAVGGESNKRNEELDDYVQEIMRERQAAAEAEARARARQEASDDGEDYDDEDDDGEDDFEDALPSNVGTPMGSFKRKLDVDGDSVSGTDTGSNTPLHPTSTSAPSLAPDAKRVKLENGKAASPLKSREASNAISEPAADSEEDEFEDV